MTASKAVLGTAGSPCKRANKRNDHCLDSEDAATVETQGKQKKFIVGPPVITNTSASTTFARVIKAIRPYIENDQHLNSNTGQLMTVDALFVMQQ